MPITTTAEVAKKYNGDESHWEHVMKVLFIPAIEKAGYEAVPPSAQGGEMIHAHIIGQLTKADMVLCDLSTLNANVMFEFGIRTALDRPIAVVAEVEKGFRLPFDTNSINTHFYEGSIHAWDLSNQIEKLAEYISATRDKSKDGNQFWHYFGLTERAEEPTVTETPKEAAMDLRLSSLDAQMDWLRDMMEYLVAQTSGIDSRASRPPAPKDEKNLERTTHSLLPVALEDDENIAAEHGGTMFGTEFGQLLHDTDIVLAFDVNEIRSFYLIVKRPLSPSLIARLNYATRNVDVPIYVVRDGDLLANRRVLQKM